MDDVRKLERGLYELVDWQEAFETWAVPGHTASSQAGSSR